MKPHLLCGLYLLIMKLRWGLRWSLIPEGPKSPGSLPELWGTGEPIKIQPFPTCPKVSLVVMEGGEESTIPCERETCVLLSGRKYRQWADVAFTFSQMTTEHWGWLVLVMKCVKPIIKSSTHILRLLIWLSFKDHFVPQGLGMKKTKRGMLTRARRDRDWIHD